MQPEVVPATTGEITDALVIVAKYPEPGQVKTRLGARIGNASAAALYRAFLCDLAVRFSVGAEQDGYRLHWASAPGSGRLAQIVGAHAHVFAQRGVDFAERLYNVAVDMRSAGYRRVVIMGSDSPHLPSVFITRAFRAIGPDHVALGPAEDGGYYLIGFELDAGVPDFFRGIQMSTSQVLDETLARATALHYSVTLLPHTFDIDEVADLTRLELELWSAEAPSCPYTRAALAQLGFFGFSPRESRAKREDEALHG